MSEDGPAILIAANATDPTPGDTLAYSIDTTGTLGTVAVQGSSFRYDPASAFQALKAGADIHTLCDARTLTPNDAGWTVTYRQHLKGLDGVADDLRDPVDTERRTVSARHVGR